MENDKPTSLLAAALILVAPLSAWLVITKLWKIAYVSAALFGRFPGGLHTRPIVDWLVRDFEWPRFAIPLLAAFFLWRFSRRLRIPSWIFGTLSLILLTAAFLYKLHRHPGKTPFQILQLWFGPLTVEVNIFVACIWREIVTSAILVLLAAAILRLVPTNFRRLAILFLQASLVGLSILLGLDLTYLMATGQPFALPLIDFSVTYLGDTGPMILAEVSPLRGALLLLGPLGTIVFYWLRRRKLHQVAQRFDVRGNRALVACAAVATVGMITPIFPAHSAPLERYTDGTLIEFARSVLVDPSRSLARSVYTEFERTGRPPWYSANMQLVPTNATVRKNVVIVMMESFRADSASMYNSKLDTTPYLNSLAQQGALVEDMSVVVPRTASAWTAILSGQYPLTNEAMRGWTKRNKANPNLRGLAHVLDEHGYATALFTTTAIGMFGEIEIATAVGFKELYDAELFSKKGRPYANYLGYPDDMLTAPILEWTARQSAGNRPFVLAIMTNVGHYAYTVPDTWSRIRFPGVSDFQYESYLNCLRYIDGFLESLIDGFRRQGHVEDTIFVFVGDHGAPFGEHGSRVMNVLYQESVHVTALIYAPGQINPNTRIEGPRQQIDILPTIAELLGYQIVNASLPGKSLLSPADMTRRLFLSGTTEQSGLAMRRGNRKYHYDFGRSNTLVFDLAADPSEAHAIANVDKEEIRGAEHAMLEWQISAKLSLSARPGSPEPGSRWVTQ